MAKEVTVIEGRYEQHELIASGGIANIFCGWDKKAECPVAIKRLRDDVHEAYEKEGLGKHEAECLKLVSHEHVMKLLADGEDSQGIYHVMELVTGPNLQEIVDAGKMNAEDFVEIARQSLKGLSAIHGKSVIHCDIKPDNIMITRKPGGGICVKIIDFGLARFEQESEELGEKTKEEIFGTPEFVSPELLQGLPPTKLSDLYALGNVFYYALCGHPAFEKDTIKATLEAHLKDQPLDLCERCPDMDRELANWVHQFIERYPEARHISADSALKELSTFSLVEA